MDRRLVKNGFPGMVGLLCLFAWTSLCGQTTAPVDHLANGSVYQVTVVNADTANHAVYHLFIPEGIGKVRVVLIHQHGCGMEGRGVATAYDLQYQAFAKKWGLAVVGPDLYYKSGCRIWKDPVSGSGPALIKALAAVAGASGHPELKSAPWLLWGHSGGGYWTLAMIKDYPERILAAFTYSPAFDPQWEFPALARKVPLMIRHAGSGDGNSPEISCWATAVHAFSRLRNAGGFTSIAYTPYQNHNYSFVRYMAIPFYESVLAQRLPDKDGVAMRDMDVSKAWLGDTLSLNTYKAAAYTKNPNTLCWLPDSLTAAKWKEYVITGSVIDRTGPPAPNHLKMLRTNYATLALSWQADADIESGIKQFNIYKDGQLISRFPEYGDYQAFDTNGDDALRVSMLAPMKTELIVSATDSGQISISSVNHFGLESPKVVFK